MATTPTSSESWRGRRPGGDEDGSHHPLHDCGHLVPWVTRPQEGWARSVAPCSHHDHPVEFHGENEHGCRVRRVEGDRVPFVLTWHSSPCPKDVEAEEALEETEKWWRQWTDADTYEVNGRTPSIDRDHAQGPHLRPTGGIVAAPTTSLPEEIGGVRNWDYRFVWLRDATFTLQTLLMAGHRREAAGLAGLAAPGGRRRSRGPADHVRGGRRTPATGVGAGGWPDTRALVQSESGMRPISRSRWMSTGS